MPRTSLSPVTVVIAICIVAGMLLLSASVTSAAKQQLKTETQAAQNLACRIVSKTNAPAIKLTPLVDASLNTMSDNPADYTFGVTIPGKRRIAAAVQRVTVRLPRDRFNVTVTLDGKPHLRLNHLDLDIYIETVIDENMYILNCFPQIGSTVLLQ